MSNDDFEITRLNYEDIENNPYKEKLEKYLDSTCFNIFITIITIWAQFGDDIRILSTDTSGDVYFDIFTILVLTIFVAEIIVTVYCKNDYLNSFFFWLDVVSTGSLQFDVTLLVDWLFKQLGMGESSNATSAKQVADAARASRIGTKAARVIRIIRLIRLIRIIKLYKQIENDAARKEEAAKKNKDAKKNERGSNYQDGEETPINKADGAESDHKKSGTAMGDEEYGDNMKKITVVDGKAISGDMEIDDQLQETNVGKRLGAKTNKIVIILILAIMISIPLFSSETYETPNNEYYGSLYGTSLHLRDATANFKNTTTGLSDNTNYDDIEFTLPYILNTGFYVNVQKFARRRIRMYFQELVFYRDSVGWLVRPKFGNKDTYDHLRLLEIKNWQVTYYPYYDTSSGGATTTYVSSDYFMINGYWDSSPDDKLGAILGMQRTVFVCVILATASLSMSNDAEDQVITPIETMINKVKRISKNPLEAAQIEEQDEQEWELLELRDKKILTLKKEKAKFETSMLESIIVKIGAQLAQGFGEAGSEIIAENMAKSGGVDPMLEGRKMFAVFGFCDIRNFEDATEILQIDVMMFVNEIADIVHNIVDDYSGAPNKNIGDAFLLIWKIPDDEVQVDDNGNPYMKGGPKTQATSDMAIFAFLKIIASINKSKKLAKYRDHEGLNKRMPGYKVRMGFGLHIGWGIEGAIGSKFKIDASYLSPNVNMAARLEAATKQFGVPLLISGGLQRFASDAYKKVQRHIDRVTVKGSIQPMDMYTIDVEQDHLSLDSKEKESMSGIEKRKLNVKRKLERDQRKDRIFAQKLTTSRLLETDSDYIEMRKPFKQVFYVRWENAQQLYLEGQWEMAKPILEETLIMIPGKTDGPSGTLLRVLNDHNNKAPSDWKGYRELTEK